MRNFKFRLKTNLKKKFYLLQPEPPCPAETTTSCASPPPLDDSSFFRPMIPASTSASFDTISALPASNASAPNAMGTIIPPMSRGIASRGAIFLLLPRPSSNAPCKSEPVGNLTWNNFMTDVNDWFNIFLLGIGPNFINR